MDAAIIESLKDTQVVVDSNLFGRNLDTGTATLAQELYNGHADKLLLVDGNFTSKVLQGFNEASKFVSLTKSYVLPEVAEEVQALSGMFANHYVFYREHLGKSLRNWRDVTCEHYDGLENLRILSDRIFGISKQLRSCGQVVYWEANVPSRWLAFARNISGDIVRRARQNKEKHMRNPSRLGEMLETDQKLAAYCFLLERHGKVALATQDYGLMELVGRMRALSNSDIHPLQHGILIYNIKTEEIADVPAVEPGRPIFTFQK